MKAGHASPFGAQFEAGKGTTFRLWAPSPAEVELQLGLHGGQRIRMHKREDGWHEVTVAEAGDGTRYGFAIDGGPVVPDPASRFNPDDVHGLSQVVDPLSYEWADEAWRGRPWQEAVIYEMHLGTFTDEGTLTAATARLDYLAKLGVTAIELMPVADFPGRRNWGYDGVLLFAPDSAYGTPADLKRFVDAAHGLGLMVFLDVVYNHFGPDGNYLHSYCPEFFNARHQTPWGAAINFDGEQRDAVRAFYVHNALYWTTEYRFDGLRLDAVHAIADDSERHIVLDIADALRLGPGWERPVHLILENERNQASLLRHRNDALPRGADAQWNDDLHHAAHVMLTGESDSYYADYADRPTGRFAKALAEGFIYQGQPSPFRDGRAHGESSAALPSTAFVSFLQNHDQIGNRAFGERLHGLTQPAPLDAAYACLLLSPQIPMLFMGEEFAASSPFLYFCDFEGDLAAAVSKGRRAEFAKFAAFSDASSRDRIPDPAAGATFHACKLNWSERLHGIHGHRLDLVRRLLQIRRSVLLPRLDCNTRSGGLVAGAGHFAIDWTLADASRWLMRANFGDRAVVLEIPVDAQVAYQSQSARARGTGEIQLPPRDGVGRLERTVTLDRAGLELLCARHGLLTSYFDIWGHRHEADSDSLVELLHELGVGPDSSMPGEQAASDPDGRRLAPVAVARAAHPGWAITASDAIAGQTIAWTLILEDGTRRRGDGRISGGGDGAASLVMDESLPLGYHRLIAEDTGESTLVIAAPETCFELEAVQGDKRVWGPSLQLYALRSQRNWGIGDFGDLLTVIDQWSAHGASLVGLNPLHALFTHNPAHISPYSPSSRLQLNTLYIDVETVDDLAECEAARSLVASAEVQNELAILRAGDEVRHAGVAALKLRVLRLLHRHFATTHRDSDRSRRGQEYRTFAAERGVALRQHAIFEALQENLHAADPEVWGWPVWPERFRSLDAPAVAAFAEAHTEEVDFFCYLQWLADGQLAKAQRRAVERGMPLGLYLDLAVSVDRAGSDAWAHSHEYAPGATVGAPPDEVNPNGQGWGLPPLRPDRMRESGHAFFIETLRAVMRHSGALRIDHVMGLMRLFWIPPGRSPTTGAYVLYPLAELSAIVALESQRHRCLIIGEDLGTVPEEIRAAMAQYQLLSYRVLYFERSADGSFKNGADYLRRSLVAVSTHDLPTLAGWWTGHDLAVRQRLGLFPAGSIYEQQLADRAQERMRLLLALQRTGLLPEGLEPRLDAAPQMTPALAEAVHAFAASSAAEVMLVQLEDILGVEDQANLPGTVDQHPNWRQRLPLGLEAQATDSRFVSLASRLAALRPRTPSSRQTHCTIVPRATYRLQFHAGFGFDDAIRVLPYLRSLGVSHVYCSPILRARRGSTHGYDVVAHDQINPELGGQPGFERFTAALREHGMGQLLDMVPNHMGVFGSGNAWWSDVLENGMSSPFSGHFDIDWHPVNAELEGKVLLPVLGQQYGDVLAAGELALAWEPAQAGFALRYHEHRFPLDPATYASLIEKAAALLGVADGASLLQSLAAAFAKLPSSRMAAESAEAIERRRDAPLFKRQLAALASERPAIETALGAATAVINAALDKNELHALHEQQSYRLAFWRVAADEINYRRFFDINELAGLRMEDPRVFEATQGFSLDLAAAGTVDGLRIDHPDGLLDPAEYFARLQDGFARRLGLGTSDESEARPLYVVAEKIAASHEDVPEEWRIHGTTGYRFAMVVNGVLVDAQSEADFDSIWTDVSGDRRTFADLTYQGKRAVADTALASELTVLATSLLRIAKANRRTRDFTLNSLRSSLAEIAACMPVYRTYVVDQPSAQDERYIDWAIAHARRHSPLADLSIFDFIRACLRNQPPPDATALQSAAIRQFAHRFQQFSSPVAAKGVEDTAFYRYHRLISLNEVGGDPATFGLTVRAFHAANADRQARWPDTIIATSTHDNKRSEDVRCRIDVLSEIPGVWRASLDRWRKLAGATRQDDAPVAAAADEYLMYQVLLGTLPTGGLDEEGLPAYRERIQNYLVKAVREGKERSSWTHPDDAYEKALALLVDTSLARVRPNPLLTDLQALATEIAWFGALNSASMVLLKYTVPGVPDLYQGNELLDLSLVDPDNRRPVDYGSRERALDHLREVAQSADLTEPLRAAVSDWVSDGRLKLWITWRLLNLRRALPEFFRQAGYLPLTTTGSHADHVIAFARTTADDALVVVAGRLFSRLLKRRTELPLASAWGDTTVEGLPEGYRTAENLLTGETHALQGKPLWLADLFSVVPAAALVLRR